MPKPNPRSKTSKRLRRLAVQIATAILIKGIATLVVGGFTPHPAPDDDNPHPPRTEWSA